MTAPTQLPEPVAHVHSNGDFCADRQITASEWPVYLVTADDMREAIATARAQALEEAKQIADSEHAAFMEQASRNNGRESDFAFGSTNAAERIAAAICSLARATTTKDQP